MVVLTSNTNRLVIESNHSTVQLNDKLQLSVHESPVDSSLNLESEASSLILDTHGKFKLIKRGETYIIYDGSKTEKQYTSQTWAIKKYNRLVKVFAKE
ncbi:MAG: hypothetical protein WC346_09775 [Methanogenium sp.]|jgi:hypothetical protein